MKIFNNFDTELRETEYQESIQKYWQKSVLLITRSNYYWLVKWILPFLGFLILSLGVFFLIYFLHSFWDILSYIVLGLWVIFFLVILKYIFNIYVHYRFDFTIVNPDEIITYGQLWLLNSSYKSFPIKKIRSIRSYRASLLGNILGYWDLIFLSDGSAELVPWQTWEKYWSWKMTLTFVKRPNQLKKLIMEICNEWTYNNIIDGDI